MTYLMTKPCPICKRQLTKQEPTDSANCTCEKYVWPAGLGPGRGDKMSGGAAINRGEDNENEDMEGDHQHGQKSSP